MAKAQINSILSQIAEDSLNKNYRLTVSDKKEHEFLVNAVLIYKNILWQLTGLRPDKKEGTIKLFKANSATFNVEDILSKTSLNRIKRACYVYKNSLESKIRERSLRLGDCAIVTSTAHGFSAMFYSVNISVFGVIKNLRLQALDKLTKVIAEEVSNSEHSKELLPRAQNAFNLGHGTSVVEQRVSNYSNALTNVLDRIMLGEMEPLTSTKTQKAISVRINMAIKTLKASKTATGSVVVYDQSAAYNNRDSGAELKRANLAKRTVTHLLNVFEEKWPDQKSSPSLRDRVMSELISAGKAAGAKGPTHKKNKSGITKSTITKTVKTNVSRTRSSDVGPDIKIRKGDNKTPQMVSLLPFINSKLTQAVIQNMGKPGLVNRTGRFASSVRAVNESTTPKGFKLFTYTYDERPYGVFSKSRGGSPWNSVLARDPDNLIVRSIREVLREKAIGRFYLRRLV